MEMLEVEIRDLPPMRVVSAQATSDTPERDAWAKLASWAKAAGLLEGPEARPVYGFNNPPPEPDRPRHGYEFWIQVEEDQALPEGLEMKEFPGGRFAVTRCKLIGDRRGSVPDVWLQLFTWVKASSHTWRETHELERLCNPGAAEEDVELELLLPIEDG